MSAICEFRVVDESADWIVVEKPAPLIVHPASKKFDEPTLIGGLKQLLAFEVANGHGLSILTRLDRETSGLVLVAKNRETAGNLSRQFQRREVKKGYLALVHGWPEWDEIHLEAPILRLGEVSECKIWLRQCIHPEGRACATDFRVERLIENGRGRFALLRCSPKTGRMHQIRVHLEALGHAIVGDKIYGHDGRAYLEQVDGKVSKDAAAGLILARHALHASYLEVNWHGERLCWRSGWPGDLARFSESI